MKRATSAVILCGWQGRVWPATVLQTVTFEVGLCLVESRAGTRLVDELTIGPHPSQHFVLDLRQIARIEEVALQKSRLPDISTNASRGTTVVHAPVPISFDPTGSRSCQGVSGHHEA